MNTTILKTMQDARAALKTVLGEEAGLVQRLGLAIHDYIKLDDAIACVLEHAKTVKSPLLEDGIAHASDVEIVDSDLLDNLLKASGR